MSVAKLGCAFIAAIIAPACILTGIYLVDQFIRFGADDPYIWIRTRKTLLLCSAVTSLHVIFLGIPGYLALRWRDEVRARSILSSGVFLGAIPIAILSWPLQYVDTKASSVHNGVATMIEGVTTVAGWFYYLGAVSFFGICGLVSAAAFWFVQRTIDSHLRQFRPK